MSVAAQVGNIGRAKFCIMTFRDFPAAFPLNVAVITFILIHWYQLEKRVEFTSLLDHPSQHSPQCSKNDDHMNDGGTSGVPWVQK